MQLCSMFVRALRQGASTYCMRLCGRCRRYQAEARSDDLWVHLDPQSIAGAYGSVAFVQAPSSHEVWLVSRFAQDRVLRSSDRDELWCRRHGMELTMSVRISSPSLS